MATRTLGIIMNGVTGRMGTNQHLIRSILAIRDQVAPPTINLDNPAVETAVDLAPNAPVKREINVALSNSFGFGGTNASVVFGKVD